MQLYPDWSSFEICNPERSGNLSIQPHFRKVSQGFEVGKALFIKKGYFKIRFAEKSDERTDKKGGGANDQIDAY